MSKGICPYCYYNKAERPSYLSKHEKKCIKCGAVSTNIEWRKAKTNKLN